MGLKDVKIFFEKYNREEDIVQLKDSSATVSLAAKALNVEPGRIAKTLAVTTKDKPILLVIAGDHKLNHSKFKKEFSSRINMVKFKDVEKVTGHPIGGVCPFANCNDLPIYLDVSLKRYETVFPACGSENSMIKLTCDELAEYSECTKWVDVSVSKK